jgi:ABC-type cobalamin/Fe3+-siderophores transport system ATPase subunit
LLRAADVTFGYGDRIVLRDVSVDVPAGGFIGIIGPNGSGKTTLLRLLAGTRRPQHGSVVLDGISLAAMPRAEIARRMAVVPQETHLAFDYTVLEVVLMGRYPHLGAFAIEGPRDIELAREALTSTGTLSLHDRMFNTLSGGEKQRVVIAAALAQLAPSTSSSAAATGASSPSSALLLDEPTAALDLKYQLETAALVRDLHARHGLTVVMSTHDLNLAASLCTALVLLKNGRVVQRGPVDDVLTPDSVRELYEVDAEVMRHPATGHLTVTPLGRAGGHG